MKRIFLTMAAACIALSMSSAQWQRNQTIAAAEYFINSDPGEGQATVISGTYGYWEVTVNIPNLNLPVGSEAYVRFKSSNGKWSAPRAIQREATFANRGATIELAEYYINTDPGRGNGTSLPNSQSGNYTLQNLALRRGDRVYFRLRDSFGRWSESRPTQFTFKDISSAQFKIKPFGAKNETAVAPMNVSAPNESSALFIATAIVDSIKTYDTVRVQFQTSDRFLSGWLSLIYLGLPVTVNEEVGIPTVFALHQNYPNPFNPSTTIRYDLPSKSHVTLTVYNTLGQKVTTLVQETQEAGDHEVRFDGSNLASGVYFYRLSAGSYLATHKMILMR
jgi:Secretion system C-terminal sorting domain